MIAPSSLLICTRCRAPASDPDAPRPGTVLLEAVRAAAFGQSAPTIRGVACLSGCTRPCCVALLTERRVTYLVGDLIADAVSAVELLDIARHHATATDGWIARAERPGRLQSGILARIPPISWIVSDGDETVTWPS